LLLGITTTLPIRDNSGCGTDPLFANAAALSANNPSMAAEEFRECFIDKVLSGSVSEG
jgi:hypothetical protein